jgi:hypothetical protein
VRPDLLSAEKDLENYGAQVMVLEAGMVAHLELKRLKRQSIA